MSWMAQIKSYDGNAEIVFKVWTTTVARKVEFA